LDFEFSGFRNLNFFLHGTMWIEEFVGLMALKRDNRGGEAVPVMAERRERRREAVEERERKREK
jgi:hypothetical protein